MHKETYFQPVRNPVICGSCQMLSELNLPAYAGMLPRCMFQAGAGGRRCGVGRLACASPDRYGARAGLPEADLAGSEWRWDPRLGRGPGPLRLLRAGSRRRRAGCRIASGDTWYAPRRSGRSFAAHRSVHVLLPSATWSAPRNGLSLYPAMPRSGSILNPGTSRRPAQACLPQKRRVARYGRPASSAFRRRSDRRSSGTIVPSLVRAGAKAWDTGEQAV